MTRAHRRTGALLLALLGSGFLLGSNCGPAQEGDGGAATTNAVQAQAAPTDADGDGVNSYCDNCPDVANPIQADTDKDLRGNQCDCDFNNDGLCNSDDASIFVADYQAGSDQGTGTDMNADGRVNDADFSLFEPMFVANAPGQGRGTPPDVVSGGAQGACWDQRVNKIFGRDNASDGCSVPLDQIPGLEALGLPPGGDLNNPTDATVAAATSGLVRCPHAAFATFHKPGSVCGVDIPLDRCGAGRAGVPCFPNYCRADGAQQAPSLHGCASNADCPANTACFSGVCNPDPPQSCTDNASCVADVGPGFVCESEVFCGDVANPLPCEKHDACGAVCGYRIFACNDQFLRDMIAVCNSLDGTERRYCRDDCLVYAQAYYDSVALGAGQVLPDLGTWTDNDLAAEADDCTCCDDGSHTPNGVPAACGNGICEAPVETCRAADCPADCGPCGAGDACLQDEDCPGLACLPDGHCGKLPASSACSSDSMCRSGNCLLGTCQSSCGDGACDGTEVCGSASPFACNADCGVCELGEACTADGDCASADTCLAGTCVPKLPDGSICESDHDCQTGKCELLTCGGVKCLLDSDCSGLGAELCVAGTCLPTKVPNGSPCVRDAMCTSGACNLGFCVAAGSVAPLLPCTTNAACSSNSCVLGFCEASCGDGVCTPVAETCGCGTNGADCNADCGKCGLAGLCNSDCDCSSGNCVAGFCVASCFANATPCLSNGDCCSGRCDGVCLACTNGACNEDSDCCGSQTCQDKILGIGDCK